MDLIGENTDAPDVFTEAGITEIRSHLNDAIEEVALFTGCHQRVWNIPLKTNCYFYEIPHEPDHFGWFVSVYLVGIQRVLIQTNVNGLDAFDARWMYSTGTPQYYVPVGVNKLCICPAPSGDEDSLEVTGVAIPARYETDEDRIKLRSKWQWACVNRAVSEFWATRGDAQSAARYFVTYAQEVGLPSMVPEMAERRWQYRTRGNG